MPVDDHPVHEKTKINSDWRYGCHNGHRDFVGYAAPDRALNLLTGNFELKAVWIDHKLSKECRYDLTHKDPACNGCKHKGKT